MTLMIYGVLTLLAALLFIAMRYGDDTPRRPGPKAMKPGRRSSAPKA